MFSVPLPDLQVEKSFVGPRTFLTVREFIWYNCSAVCGSFVWWLYGGVNGDLLQEGLCHRLCVPSLLQPESLPLQQATADPCLCRRHSLRGRSGSVSVGSLGPGAHRFFLSPLSKGSGKKYLPSWTHLILISLCCILGLCYSFKSCALALSLLLQNNSL